MKPSCDWIPAFAGMTTKGGSGFLGIRAYGAMPTLQNSYISNHNSV